MAHPAVSIGLLLPTREVVMASGAPDLSKIIDLAVQAEELGQAPRMPSKRGPCQHPTQ